MKPIEFEGFNVTFAKDQPGYLPLPAYRDPGPEGQGISCWQLTFKERVKIMFTGKLWISLYMFGKPLTPQRPSVNKWDVFNKEAYTQLIKPKR